ncbi:hypothetical protein MRX96_007329 [Rhipicephalus microplus]
MMMMIVDTADRRQTRSLSLFLLHQLPHPSANLFLYASRVPLAADVRGADDADVVPDVWQKAAGRQDLLFTSENSERTSRRSEFYDT